MRTVHSNHKIGYAVASAILAVLIPLSLLPADSVRFAAAAALAVAAVAASLFVKKRRILSFNKRQVLFLMAVIGAVYLMLYYLTGLHFGFATLYRGLSISIAWRFVLPIVVIVVGTEIVRYVLLSQEKFWISLLTYFICLFSETALAGGIWGIDSVYRLMDFVGMTLLPAITANLLYHYICKRYGALPNIVLRLMLSLYIYLIPFIPNAPQILPAFASLILPLLIYLFIDMLFEKKKRLARRKTSKWTYVGGAVTVAVLACVMLLISCQFRYGVLVIGSPSMTGEINKGDAVFFEDAEHNVIEEGDVIVFTKNGSTTRTVHRVVEIQHINGEIRYITKGDANLTNDPGYITSSDIIGKVHFKILYIGYPSLWLHQIFT